MPWRYWSSGLVGSRKAPGSVISKGIGRQTYTHLYILEMMENLTAKVATSCYSIAQFSQKGVQVDKKVHLTVPGGAAPGGAEHAGPGSAESRRRRKSRAGLRTRSFAAHLVVSIARKRRRQG